MTQHITNFIGPDPRAYAKCRKAYDDWLLNGNRFMTDPFSIFKAGYDAYEAAKSEEQVMEGENEHGDAVKALCAGNVRSNQSAPSTTQQPVQIPEREEERFESAWTSEELLSQSHLVLTKGPGKRDAISIKLANRINKFLTLPQKGKAEGSELKTCPFCDCDRVGVECGDGGPALRKLTYNARCHNCMASCAGYGTRELAVHHWNRRATRERESLSQWQPIETAPKDGREILVFIPSYFTQGCAAVRWCAEDNCWKLGFTGAYAEDSKIHDREPTHWMEIPPVSEIEDAASK